MDFELTWIDSRKCWKKYRKGKYYMDGDSACRPDDVLVAKGLVAAVRKPVSN